MRRIVTCFSFQLASFVSLMNVARCDSARNSDDVGAHIEVGSPNILCSNVSMEMKRRENCGCEANGEIQNRESKPYPVPGFLVMFPMGEECETAIKETEEREDKVNREARGEGKHIDGSRNCSDGRKGVDVCKGDICCDRGRETIRNGGSHKNTCFPFQLETPFSLMNVMICAKAPQTVMMSAPTLK
jgi:hypothetical protein